MKGLILAAGRGIRLRPYSFIFPKALIPLKGRPMIQYVLDSIKKTEIDSIGVVINPKDRPLFEKSLNQSRLKFLFQPKPKGTAHALSIAEDFIKDEVFLVCWCDFLSPYDFKKLIRHHLRTKALATLLINREENPRMTAQVLLKRDRICYIEEKPKRIFSCWGSAGAMILEPRVLKAFKFITASYDKEYHIASLIQYWIKKDAFIAYTRLNTWRLNVNTPSDLRKAWRLASRLLNH